MKVSAWAEKFAAIRRDHRVDGVSISSVADRYPLHRRMVRQAPEWAIPPQRKVPERIAPRLKTFKCAIDEMLRTDFNALRSNAIPLDRSWPGSSMSMAQWTCRIRQCATW